ncbi:hypothetical protein EBR96_08385, partial [bacterium]|nr:hypothetical protein [bacterium]
MPPIPFETTDWSHVTPTEHPGETGVAYWRTLQYPGLRIRHVEYSPGYLADHWCEKGHIIFCIDGEMVSELSDGREFVLRKGMSYQVTDGASSHRSRTEMGARLFIVDGEFLG